MGHTRGLFFWVYLDYLDYSGLLGLLADLPADGVFLLIERFLLGGRDVAVVELRHRPLFLADSPILAVKLAGLAFADFAFPHLAIDAPILILQTIVDLGASRVILLPLRLGHGVRHGDAGERDAQMQWRLLLLPGSWVVLSWTSRAATPAQNARFEAVNRH